MSIEKLGLTRGILNVLLILDTMKTSITVFQGSDGKYFALDTTDPGLKRFFLDVEGTKEIFTKQDDSEVVYSRVRGKLQQLGIKIINP